MTAAPRRKGQTFASREFTRIASSLSKEALIDIAHGLCLLGTNETEGEIITKFCREVEIVGRDRGDRVTKEVKERAKLHIDSDGDDYRSEIEE